MSRGLMLIVLGALVMLAPFSGLPMRILIWILPVLGLAILLIGISYKRERVRATPSSHEASVPASV